MNFFIIKLTILNKDITNILLGSVAEKVARHSSATVMIIR